MLSFISKTGYLLAKASKLSGLGRHLLSVIYFALIFVDYSEAASGLFPKAQCSFFHSSVFFSFPRQANSFP